MHLVFSPEPPEPSDDALVAAFLALSLAMGRRSSRDDEEEDPFEIKIELRNPYRPAHGGFISANGIVADAQGGPEALSGILDDLVARDRDERESGKGKRIRWRSVNNAAILETIDEKTPANGTGIRRWPFSLERSNQERIRWNFFHETAQGATPTALDHIVTAIPNRLGIILPGKEQRRRALDSVSAHDRILLASIVGDQTGKIDAEAAMKTDGGFAFSRLDDAVLVETWTPENGLGAPFAVAVIPKRR